MSAWGTKIKSSSLESLTTQPISHPQTHPLVDNSMITLMFWGAVNSIIPSKNNSKKTS